MTFDRLHRGQKVFVGDKFDLRNCEYLKEAIVIHNWPSQWHSRFPSGYILLSVREGEKKYRKYFDLADQTINGTPSYIFIASKEAEEFYLLKSAKQQEEKLKAVDVVKALMIEGNTMYASGNLWGAVRKYKEVTEMDSSNAGAHSRLGHTQLKLGLYEDALEALGRALSLACDSQVQPDTRRYWCG